MLVALKQNGQYISLLDNWTRDQLVVLRKNESFLCPICKHLVELKLGSKRIYHFAHKQNAECSKKYEPETLNHLDGKKQLFTWLKKQFSECQLEYYVKDIDQRPDIYFEASGVKYAIEFQCSQISEELFNSRTRKYQEAAIIPIWIIGGQWLKLRDSNSLILSPFQWQFASTYFQNYPIIYYFCPQSSQFTIASHLTPFSTTKTYSKIKRTPINNLTFNTLLKDRLYDKNYIQDLKEYWIKEKQQFRLAFSIYPSPHLKRILRVLYENRIPPALLPAEAGLPVKSMYWLKTPVTIWEMWILLDSIFPLPIGAITTFEKVYKLFSKRVSRGDIEIRNLPLVNKTHYSFAIMEYLQILVKLRFLIKKDKTTFIKVKQVSLPSSNENADELDKQVINWIQ